MRSNSMIRALFSIAAVAAVVAGAQGCVADRPSRNGVFNENQYVRKDFLVQPGNGGAGDPGWFMKATVMQTSTPNPLATVGLNTGSESSGTNGYGNIVRFVITSDKLDMVNVRELSNTDASTTRTHARRRSSTRGRSRTSTSSTGSTSTARRRTSTRRTRSSTGRSASGSRSTSPRTT